MTGEVDRMGVVPSGGSTTGTGTGGAGALDIASTVASMLPGLVAFFKGIFGNYTYTTGVRWLTQQYQYYVLGQANATGTHTSTGVNEKYTPEAQAWFTAVLGVPIYDRERLHALMGTRVSDGANLNQTDQQRVDSYLRPAWTDTQGEDPARVMRAVQIAKQFRWGAAPGSWAKYGIPADPPEVTNQQSGSGGGLTAGGEPNYSLWAGVAAVGLALYLMYDSDG